jgi:hypothetical protein
VSFSSSWPGLVTWLVHEFFFSSENTLKNKWLNIFLYIWTSLQFILAFQIVSIMFVYSIFLNMFLYQVFSSKTDVIIIFIVFSYWVCFDKIVDKNYTSLYFSGFFFFISYYISLGIYQRKYLIGTYQGI